MIRGLIAFGLLVSASVVAETFPDPTRPPAMLLGGDGGTANTPAVPRRPAGLQSTIISPSHRAAIIDGETVELWAKHGNEQLIEVNETSVVLKSARGTRTLTLFPDIRMTKFSGTPVATGEKK
jgi:hypothetical protein